MNKNKTALYLVAIVSIVAAVGILILILNASESAYISESDLSGEAVSAMKTSGSLSGIKPPTKVSSSTTNAGSGKCCDYTDDGRCIPKCH
ncbi:MAG: hypothetical protein AABX82_05985 [Nanoarchaeota archaeon]